MSTNLPNPESFSPAEVQELESILSRLAAVEAAVAQLQSAPVVGADLSKFVTLEQLAGFGIHL